MIGTAANLAAEQIVTVHGVAPLHSVAPQCGSTVWLLAAPQELLLHRSATGALRYGCSCGYRMWMPGTQHGTA